MKPVEKLDIKRVSMAYLVSSSLCLVECSSCDVKPSASLHIADQSETVPDSHDARHACWQYQGSQLQNQYWHQTLSIKQSLQGWYGVTKAAYLVSSSFALVDCISCDVPLSNFCVVFSWLFVE